MTFLEMSINRNKTAPKFLPEELIKLIWRRSRGPGGGTLSINTPTEAGKRNMCQVHGTAAMEMHLSVLQGRTLCEESG